MRKVVVVGGGAAGTIAAIIASKNCEVIMLEKKSDIGNKIKITGKGRCNLTFKGDFEYLKKNILENGKFMYSSFNLFNNNDLINFVNELGVETKEERGNRIFLKNDNALDLVQGLKQELKNKNVKVIYNAEVKNVEKTLDNKVLIKYNDNKNIVADKCIIATGGKSYPATGSTGDGYAIAQKLGHTIIGIKPGLVAIKSKDVSCKNMQGLTLKNVSVNILVDNKIIYNNFGEMMFTHFGVTGPIILSGSSKLCRESDLNEKFNLQKIKLSIDLKPALSYEVLDKRICNDFEKYINKELKNSLDDLLPKKIIPEVIIKAKLNKNKKVNQITKEEREKLLKTIKAFEIILSDLMPVETGIVTVGGVDLKEINPKTFESKLKDNIYFVGEVLNLDAYTGGFNLQIAFSSGYACGYYIQNDIQNEKYVKKIE